MSHFNVRHPRARADSEIEKEHDTFSLVKIVSTEFPDVEAQVKDISLFHDLQSSSCLKVCKCCYGLAVKDSPDQM